MNNIDIRNNCINFNAGMTLEMKNEIRHCDVRKISNFIEKQNISNDFKDNQVIAWCSLKCVQLIQAMNKLYNFNIELPKGIFVENFEKLKCGDKNSYGFVNFAPVRLYKEKADIVPEKTIFFNEFKDKKVWSEIDSLSERDYESGMQATDFFIEKFFHEFIHVFHEQNLMSKFDADNLLLFLRICSMSEKVQIFQKKYSQILKNICDYAATNPMEAVACDMSKRMINSIDKNNLYPKTDFISHSPYTKQSLFNKIFMNKTDKILTKIWNGKIFDL